jgi:hypothetical protein
MDTKKIVLLGISILIIVASVGYIFRSKEPPVQIESFDYVGTIMANQTVKLLGNKGEVLVLVEKDESPNDKSPQKMLQKLADQFQDALKKTDVKIKAIEALTDQQLRHQIDPSSPTEIRGLTSELLFGLLEKYPGVSAVVSFLGTPIIYKEDLSKFTETTPKLLVFAISSRSLGLNIKQLLTENIVQVAIVRRFSPLSNPDKKPSTMEETFNRSYEVVTPENAESFPEF